MYRNRVRRTLWFFAKIMLSVLWWELILPKIGFRKVSAQGRSKRILGYTSAFRKLAVQMGGVMIKMGQFLSSRLDVLPREITAELSGLQDEVQPENVEDIRKVIESEYGVPLEQRFADFDPQPIAAASIGQVHIAHLCQSTPGGDPCPAVVVKVQRPDIDKIVEVDLASLRTVGKWVSRFKTVRKRANVPALLEEFGSSLLEEIDYLHEGKNAEQFAANFTGRPEICVPQVIWSHTTKRVLVLEDVRGIKITDYAAIDAAGIDRKEVAARLLEIYLQQVFEDGFFHADPHPGNLFVQLAPTVENPKAWQLNFVDFGMTGTLPAQTKEGLREILFAVGTKDAGRLVRAFQMMNFLLPGTDLDLLERMSSRMFQDLWGKSTDELVKMKMHREEMEQFAQEFGDLLYEMPFQIPENLILFGRMVSILSGMCTGLYSDFNVWQYLAPYAQKMIEAESGGTFQTILKEAGSIFQTLITLPKKAEHFIDRIEQGKLEVRLPEMREHFRKLERSQRKMANAVVFAAFLLSGVQLYLSHQIWWAVGFGAAAFIALLVSIFGR
jgi:predicted unusual protein kinase regulating ubiquinone biosynthesis (AarF/ABC1/UbiB family)